MTWAPASLDTAADIVAGYAFPSSGYETTDTGCRLLRGITVGPQRLDWSEPMYWPRATDDGLKKFELVSGDIVIAMDRPWISEGFRVAQLSSADTPALLVQRVARLRAKKGFDGRFLYHLMCSGRLQHHLQGRHTETTVPHVSHKDIASFEFTAPPLAEQKRIAAILDKADAIRRKRQEAIRLTETLLRSAFLEMFGDPVTNPKGWEVKKLGEVTTIKTGNTPSRADEANFGDAIEWIKTDNINTPSHYLTRSSEGLSERGRRLGRTVSKGSTLMTCIAGSASVIGNVAIADRDVAFNQQINAVTPGERLDQYYLYGALLLSKTAVQRLSTGGMKGLVSKGRLSKLAIPLPGLDLQASFGALFLGHSSAATRVTAAADTTTELCGTLTQRAFAGRL